ncbi:hypothetical protein Btru_023223 [Bulinus truncatus]|nr:hypothetical protein Btru_023223 [Bulinus truncatus]
MRPIAEGKMFRLHLKKVAKIALTICVGSFLVNLLYKTYCDLRMTNNCKQDLEMDHSEKINSLSMTRDRLQQSDSVHGPIGTRDNDYIGTHKNLIFSRSTQHKSSINSEKNNLPHADDDKKERFGKNSLKIGKGTTGNRNLHGKKTFPTYSPSRPSKKTQKENGQTHRKTWGKRGKSKDQKKDIVFIPQVVENLDEFHDDVLKNEIWKLDDVISKASGKTNHCPDQPPRLDGELTGLMQDITKEELVKFFPQMEPGGRLRPSDCVPRQRMAFILPYRNRYQHLHITIHNLIPILHRQQADVRFFVVEQAPPSTFNKGALMNAGFIEANKLGNFDCFILHDVDLIPLNDFNLYRCDSNPRHYAVSIDKFNFRLCYPTYFGGVVGFAKDHYLKVNGNSNLYIGWGGEDDDLRLRMVNKNFTILRYPIETARYSMIKHARDKGNELNPFREAILKSAIARHEIDGLNSVRYKVLNITSERLYTWITVSINNTKILQSVPAMTLADIEEAKRQWLADKALTKRKQELTNTRNSHDVFSVKTNVKPKLLISHWYKVKPKLLISHWYKVKSKLLISHWYKVKPKLLISHWYKVKPKLLISHWYKVKPKLLISHWYKMSRLHFKQLAKLALTICVGSFLVNILYTIYWGPEVKNERRTDLQSYHLENITSLLMIQQIQRQPGVGRMSIDSFDYDDIDTERNLISSNSILLKNNATAYEEKKLTTEENLKEKFFKSGAITTNGSSDKNSLLTNATLEPSLSDRPSEETRKMILEKPRGDWNERMNSKDVKKDKRNIPINVDNIDDFHEDVLRNEIWHLDEVNPMASGNVNYCPDKPPRLSKFDHF